MYMYIYSVQYNDVKWLTTGVPDVDLWDTTTLSVDVIAPIKQSHGSLHEAHSTGQVQWGVPLTVTHEGISIGLQEVLDHLVLTSEYSQVQGRLCVCVCVCVCMRVCVLHVPDIQSLSLHAWYAQYY